MNIFNLFAKITLDKEDYEKNVEQVKQKNKELEKNTKDTSNKGILAFGAVAGAIALVTKATIDLIQSTANYADQIGDLAQKWGFTTQEIQEFEYWATMSGTTLDSLLTGMRGLVNQAEAGSDAFKKLGVSVKNQDGTLKGQKQLFLETIDALKKIDNQTERNALQFEIFGRAGIELGQVISRDSAELAQLSQDAENLGIILKENTIEQAGKFNDTLDQMKLSAKSVLADFFAGSEGADENLQAFLNSVIAQAEEWTPRLVSTIIQALPKLIEPILKSVSKVPSMLFKSLAEIDWAEWFYDLFTGLIDGVITMIRDGLGSLFGYGWLWGGQDVTDDSSAFKETMTSLSNSSTSNLNYTNENSTYNVNVNMSSSGYTEQDAKKLADEVIKELATKKQASGR